MTRAQRKVMDAIEGFIAEHKHAPSYAEIAKLTGLRSLATVSKHIHNLQEQGLLKKSSNRGRTLELVNIENKVRILRVTQGTFDSFFVAIRGCAPKVGNRQLDMTGITLEVSP